MRGTSCLRWLTASLIGLGLALGLTLAAATGVAEVKLAPVTDLDKPTDGWDALLAKHVRPSGGVDYVGFANDLPKLKEFTEAYAKIAFATASDEAKKAAYINLYNAGMIYNILRYAAAQDIAPTSPAFTTLKIDTLKSGDGNIWNGEYTFDVGGNLLTLDDIEHHLLRGVDTSAKQEPLKVSSLDPRLHAAVNCAAYSCPRLRSSAYRATTIDADLQQAMQEYLSDSEQFQKQGDSQLKANSIVFWYYDDFEAFGKKARKGGAGGYLAEFILDRAEAAVWKRTFLRDHFNDRSKLALKLSRSFAFHYNWLINDVRNKP